MLQVFHHSHQERPSRLYLRQVRNPFNTATKFGKEVLPFFGLI